MSSKVFSFPTMLLLLCAGVILVGCINDVSFTATAMQTRLTITATTIISQQLETPQRVETEIQRTPQATIAAKSTLTMSQREEYIQTLLQDPQDCELPCWWGIEPGKTAWKQAEAQFLQMGIEPSSTTRTEGTIHHEVHFDQSFAEKTMIQWIEFEEKSEEITQIKVRAIPNGNPEQFVSLWKTVSPEVIIRKYGEPDRVWLQSRSSGRDVVGYSLWLFYDVQGFLLISSGSTNREETYTICPSFNSMDTPIDIELVMQSPQAPVALETLTEQYGPVSKPYILPMETAANLSVRLFSQAYLKNGSSYCFETPQNIWAK